MSSVVWIECVFKEYLFGEQIVQVFNDIILVIEFGVFFVILGFLGSGKIMMFNLIGCIDWLISGNIYINEENVFQKFVNEFVDLCVCLIGFIFQIFNLLFVFLVVENVEYLLLCCKDVLFVDCKQCVDYFFDIVGFSKYVNNCFNQLSGGQ